MVDNSEDVAGKGQKKGVFFFDRTQNQFEDMSPKWISRCIKIVSTYCRTSSCLGPSRPEWLSSDARFLAVGKLRAKRWHKGKSGFS